MAKVGNAKQIVTSKGVPAKVGAGPVVNTSKSIAVKVGPSTSIKTSKGVSGPVGQGPVVTTSKGPKKGAKGNDNKSQQGDRRGGLASPLKQSGG